MVVEVTILRREDGTLDVQRDIRQGDGASVGVTEATNLGGPIGVVDDRGLRGGDLVGLRHRSQDDREGKGTGSQQAEGEQSEEDPPEPVLPAGRLSRLGTAARPGVPTALACHGDPPAIDGLP